MVSFSACLDLPALLRMSWNAKKKTNLYLPKSFGNDYFPKIFCYLQSNTNLTYVLCSVEYITLRVLEIWAAV